MKKSDENNMLHEIMTAKFTSQRTNPRKDSKHKPRIYIPGLDNPMLDITGT